MTLFLPTLLITLVCCLLMAAGLLLRGKPLTGRCGNTPPGVSNCAGCPNRGRHPPGNCPHKTGDH